MTIYYAKIKGWPIELDAKSLNSLKKLARKVAKENDLGRVELVKIEKYTESRQKLKNIKI